jgi:hypothetical protein
VPIRPVLLVAALFRCFVKTFFLQIPFFTRALEAALQIRNRSGWTPRQGLEIVRYEHTGWQHDDCIYPAYLGRVLAVLPFANNLQFGFVYHFS